MGASDRGGYKSINKPHHVIETPTFRSLRRVLATWTQCDYYRRSMPGPNLRPRQARIRNEQQYLSDRLPGGLQSSQEDQQIASPPPFDEPPTEMTGNWWSQNELVPATRDYL
ncbi:hypothetical protein FRC00_002861 [Tulasnella sp. 408]|nr:hypothetical protein FRC00_002861 [Tulasnella sp. 408]